MTSSNFLSNISTFRNTVTDNFTELNDKINDELVPNIDTNKNKLDELDTKINDEILPVTTDFIELYEVIIIRILLSKLFIFLNHIFKWYTYMIQEVDNESVKIKYIISLSETNTKNTYKIRYKEFKNKMKKIKKEYNISYKKLVTDTIYYTQSIIRK